MKEAIKFSYDSNRSATRIDVSFLVTDAEESIQLPAHFNEAELQDDGSKQYPFTVHNMAVLIMLIGELQSRKENSGS